jgi:hypothetical protein
VTPARGDVVPAMGERRRSPHAAGLALLVALPMLATGILLARLVVNTTWERVTTQDAENAPYARFRAFRDAVPQIVTAPNSAIAMGFCFSEKGFIPEAFDDRMSGAHGRQLTTFSIATSAMHSSTLEEVVRTLGAAYRSAGTRPELAVIELSPSMVVPESSESLAAPVGYNRTLQGLLIRDLDAWARASARSASLGVEILGNWLLGGPTKAYTGELFCSIGLDARANCQAQAPGWWPWPSDDRWAKFQAKIYRVWSRFAPALRRDNGEHALSWSLARRGYIERIPDSLRSEHDAFARERTQMFEEPGVADFTRYDREVISKFPLDGEGFQRYLAGLRALQAMGAKVVVYIIPKANYLIAGPQDARLLQGFFDAAARKINALGIPVIQMSSASYDLSEFQNTWVLLSEDTGGIRFSRELADMVAAVLAGAPLPPRVARLLPSRLTGEGAAAAPPAQDPFWRSAPFTLP